MLRLALLAVIISAALSAPVADVDAIVPESSLPQTLATGSATGSADDDHKKDDVNPDANMPSSDDPSCGLPDHLDPQQDRNLVVHCNGIHYDIHMPVEGVIWPFGLIMDIHGSGMTALQEEQASGIGHYGSQEGYVVIQPTEGVDADWGSDTEGTYQWKDIEKLEAFLKHFIDHYSSMIDTSKVHVAGFSQGAFISWNMLCRSSDVICSIAPTGFNALGKYDRIHAGFELSMGKRKNCWKDGSGPETHRSIFYTQGSHDVLGSPALFEESVDAIKNSYGISGDGDSVSGKGDGVDWTKYECPQGAKVETALFDYKATHDGKPVVWYGWLDIKGHCFPSTKEDGAPNWPLGSCGGPGAFTWGKEVVRFFKQNPCQ